MPKEWQAPSSEEDLKDDGPNSVAVEEESELPEPVEEQEKSEPVPNVHYILGQEE